MVTSSKSKPSALVQKNLKARIAKTTSDEDHHWMSSNLQPPKFPHSNKMPMNYVKMGDVESGMNENKALPDEQPGGSTSSKTIETNSHYRNYEELDDAGQAKRVIISSARKDAEQGPFLLQALAFVGGISMVFTSILDFQVEASAGDGLSITLAIMSMYTWLFGTFIVGIEGRVLLIDIYSLHKMISNYMKLFRFVWGRGLFYFFAGSLQYCQQAPLGSYCGIFMMIIGLIMFVTGMILKGVLNSKLQAVPDGGQLQTKFDFFDTDSDGFIDAEQFKDFIRDMGLHEYEDIDFDAEFGSTDTDNDGLINFPEFMRWVEAMEYRKQSLLTIFETAAIYMY